MWRRIPEPLSNYTLFGGREEFGHLAYAGGGEGGDSWVHQCPVGEMAMFLVRFLGGLMFDWSG
jgi:hypothetical protein